MAAVAASAEPSALPNKVTNPNGPITKKLYGSNELQPRQINPARARLYQRLARASSLTNIANMAVHASK